MGLVRMDIRMMCAGGILLLIAVLFALGNSKNDYGPSTMVEEIVDKVEATMFFVAGLVLVIYGLLKNGITPPPPR
jgi:Na+/H+ antiporter NhaD/arsenite permease-like protein